jgi:hypothetical protein
MFDAYGRTAEVALILGIAEALREEFGESIDAHPGGVGSEAGTVNRALRAVTRRVLKAIVPLEEDLPAVVTCVLREAALHRLSALGVQDRRAEMLLDMEPALGDAWLAYLALAPSVVVGDLLDESGGKG